MFADIDRRLSTRSLHVPRYSHMLESLNFFGMMRSTKPVAAAVPTETAYSRSKDPCISKGHSSLGVIRRQYGVYGLIYAVVVHLRP